MDELCYLRTTVDPEVAGNALAFAGILAAAYNGLYDINNNLIQILGKSEQNSLLWRFPSSADTTVLDVVKDTELAEVWKSVVEDRVPSGSGGNRLRILPGVVSPQQLMEVLSLLLAPYRSRYGKNNWDWRNVERWLTTSVTVLTSQTGSPHAWQWPLRTNAPDELIPIFREESAFRRGLANLREDSSAKRKPDLLIRVYKGLENIRTVGQQVGLGVQIHEPTDEGNAAIQARLRKILERNGASRRPEVLLQLPSDTIPQFLKGLIYGLSHDAPLDVALFDSYVRLRLSDLPPPILLAPALDSLEAMESARLNQRVREMVSWIGHLPDTLLDAVKLDITNYSLGIKRGQHSLRTFRGALSDSLLKGSVWYDRESHTGEQLLHVTRQLGHLEKTRSKRKQVRKAFKALQSSPERDRFLDALFLRGHYSKGDQPDLEYRVSDTTPLAADAKYTLELAIREKLQGIDAGRPGLPVAPARRKEKETVTIYARVWSSDERILKFEDGFLPFEWPYNSDSHSVYFRCSTRRPSDPNNKVYLEIRLYSHDLHLLELVQIKDIFVSDDSGATDPRYKYWPSSRSTILSQASADKPVELSLHVRGESNGFTMEAIFRRGNYEFKPMPLGRTVLSQDVADLLTSVRDNWTRLSVQKLARRVKLTETGYKEEMKTLWDLGGRAWKILFGDRRGAQAGGSETLGELIVKQNFPKDSLIQITSDSDAVSFVYPWLILRPPAPRSSPVTPESFWGLSYIIEQTKRRGQQDLDLGGTPVRIVSVVDPGFAGSVDHVTTLKAIADEKYWSTLIPVDKETTLLDELEEAAPAQLFYFFCHGFSPGNAPHMAEDVIKKLREEIKESNDREAWTTFLNRLSSVPGEAKMFIGTSEITETDFSNADFFKGVRRPIIFLNMCQSADLLPSRERGFVHQFIDRNASAVIGTECPMTSVFADLYAKEVLSALARHEPVGSAVLNARRHFHAQRNPLGFAYTVYGRADAYLGPRRGEA